MFFFFMVHVVVHVVQFTIASHHWNKRWFKIMISKLFMSSLLLCMDLWITLHSSIITDICKTQQAMNKTFDKGLKKIDSSIVWDKQGMFFCFWNGTCVFESRKIIKILAIWEKILVYHNYELYWLVSNLNV